MPRQATGTVLERQTTTRGRSYALRFRAFGRRQFVHLGYEDEGWTRRRADDELTIVMAQVRQGTWRPPAPVDTPSEHPTFHEFASDWFAEKRHELRPSTVAAYEAELSGHLLPFFRGHRLRDITVAEVDRYRARKLEEGRRRAAQIEARRARIERGKDPGPRVHPLGPETVNKTITRLGQILAVAEERDLIDRNPVRVNPASRKAKTSKAATTSLDSAEQIRAILDAAAELDGGRQARTEGRRALVATLVLGGLRIGEACALTWGDVDLAAGRLTVRAAKTDAGVREVDLRPALLGELKSHKASSRAAAADDRVFTTAAGTPRDKDNARTRVVDPVVARAREILERRGGPRLPPRVTAHSMRRTFISVLLALGEDVPYVMAQVGHTDPKVTLGIYARVMRRDDGWKGRLRTLVDGAEWAPMGTEGPVGAGEESEDSDGRGGFRTCDLSRVKRALSH